MSIHYRVGTSWLMRQTNSTNYASKGLTPGNSCFGEAWSIDESNACNYSARLTSHGFPTSGSLKIVTSIAVGPDTEKAARPRLKSITTLRLSRFIWVIYKLPYGGSWYLYHYKGLLTAHTTAVARTPNSYGFDHGSSSTSRIHYFSQNCAIGKRKPPKWREIFPLIGCI